MMPEVVGVISHSALITPNFLVGVSREIIGDWVEK